MVVYWNGWLADDEQLLLAAIPAHANFLFPLSHPARGYSPHQLPLKIALQQPQHTRSLRTDAGVSPPIHHPLCAI